MGPVVSKTKTSVDVVNEVVNEVTTNVLNENKTEGGGIQRMNISCSDAAHTAATAACSVDTRHRNEMIARMVEANPKINIKDLMGRNAEEMEALEPASCKMCSAEDINQDMNITIKVDAVNDNTIANKIQADLLSKLEALSASKTDGGMSLLTISQLEAASKLKNHVRNKFDTTIVNSTINTFQFEQDIVASNQKLKKVNQKLVGTAISTALVRNAIESSSEIKSAVDAIVTVTSDTKGADPFAIFGGLTMMIVAMVGGIIALIFLVFAAKRLISTASDAHTKAASLPPVPSQPFFSSPQQPSMFSQPQPQMGMQPQGFMQGLMSQYMPRQQSGFM